MQIRTKETTVTFLHPFVLKALGASLPAGTYRVVNDEHEITGLSFLAFERGATMLHVPAISTPGGRHQVFTIDPAELEAAMEADASR